MSGLENFRQGICEGTATATRLAHSISLANSELAAEFSP